MNKLVNWDIAPIDATHHGAIVDPNVVPWYKFDTSSGQARWSYWYSDGGILSEKGWQMIPAGQPPMTLPVTPRPGYTAPSLLGWREGIDLPPVGTVAIFDRDQDGTDSTLFKQPISKGTEVTIIAHFKSNGVDLAAFTYRCEQGGVIVRQAIATTFIKKLTPQQIAENERRKVVDKILLDMNLPLMSDYRDFLMDLYDKGYLEP